MVSATLRKRKQNFASLSQKKKAARPPKNIKPVSAVVWKDYLFPAIIAGVAFALYAKTLSFNFVYHDDDTMIVTNTQKLETANLKTALFTDAWFREKEIELYRPWQSITYIIDYKLWQVNPMGYHLHNVLIFCAALLAVYFLLLQIKFTRQWSFVLTLFYSCHYLFAHTVSWIPARGDLYLTLFGTLSLISLLNYFRNGSTKNLVVGAVFYFFALLAKETAIVLLPVAALLRWAELKFNVKQLRSLFGIWLLPMLLLTIIYFLLRSKSIASMGYVSPAGALYNLPVIPESVFKFFVPAVFCVLPGYNTMLTVAGCVIIFIAVGLLFIVRNSEVKFLAFTGLAMFLLALLPSLFYKPNFSGFAYDYLDHRMFFAGLGLLIFTGSVLHSFTSKAALLQKVLLAVAVVEAGLSFYYQEAYRDYHHYYQNGMNTNPKSALAMLNYGILLREREKDFQKSVEVLTKGSQAYPDSTAFLNEKAGSFFALQKYDSMYATAQRMAQYPDRKYEALVYTGIYYNEKGFTDSALNAFSKAIEMNPRRYATYYNRAKIYRQLKNWDAMVADLNEAIRLKPDYAEAYSERGNLYGNFGQFDKALNDYDKYVNLRPDDATGYFYRGQAFALLGKKVEGCNDLRKAVEMGLPEAKAKYGQLCN
jgi:tetratricopeptide (TPR) repeat protein